MTYPRLIQTLAFGLFLGVLFPLLAQADHTPNHDTLQSLSERVNRLEDEEFLKMLRPVKDIDFLYDAYIGYGTEAIVKTPECKEALKNIEAQAVYFEHQWFWRHAILDANFKKVDAHALPMLCKLAAVEKMGKTIFGATPPTNQPMVKRLEQAYRLIQNKDWKSDRLRFGVMATQVDKLKSVATSLVLHAYPSYRRFMPGRFDLLRRTSIYFGLGAISDSGDTVETEGPIYSAGFGLDIAKGFSILAGYSLYQKKEGLETNFQQSGSVIFGISLTSELWKGLFGPKN